MPKDEPVFRLIQGQRDELVENLIRECAKPGVDNFEKIDAIAARLKKSGNSKPRRVR